MIQPQTSTLTRITAFWQQHSIAELAQQPTLQHIIARLTFKPTGNSDEAYDDAVIIGRVLTPSPQRLLAGFTSTPDGALQLRLALLPHQIIVQPPSVFTQTVQRQQLQCGLTTLNSDTLKVLQFIPAPQRRLEVILPLIKQQQLAVAAYILSRLLQNHSANRDEFNALPHRIQYLFHSLRGAGYLTTAEFTQQFGFDFANAAEFDAWDDGGDADLELIIMPRLKDQLAQINQTNNAQK